MISQEKEVMVSELNSQRSWSPIVILDPTSHKFPYEVLRTSFPSGIEPTQKEYYLTDVEFKQYIGMTRPEWDALK